MCLKEFNIFCELKRISQLQQGRNAFNRNRECRQTFLDKIFYNFDTQPNSEENSKANCLVII